LQWQTSPRQSQSTLHLPGIAELRYACCRCRKFDRTILCGMWDLCRLFVGLVVDLFRSRAALEAEVLVLKQQIIVLRRGKPCIDKIFSGFPDRRTGLCHGDRTGPASIRARARLTCHHLLTASSAMVPQHGEFLIGRRNIMTKISVSEAAKAVIRRNTEEVQGGGNFEVFEELFADDFLDHTPQPGRTPDKAGARELYKVLRAAFPDFHADIHWQLADGDRVTTYKTYHGTHQGEFFGMTPTGRKIQFETVDVMRVRDGKITEHWGVANLFSLMQQLGAFPVTPKV
jgi:steroid delta-isomerase-like uncharacterized protein